MGKTKTSIECVAKASLRNVRLSPRKARLVVDLIRGKGLDDALDILEYSDKKTAPLLRKLVLSAAANAKDRSGMSADELVVKAIWVDEGKKLKRSLPRAQGRATPIRKRSSSINLVLDEAV